MSDIAHTIYIPSSFASVLYFLSVEGNEKKIFEFIVP